MKAPLRSRKPPLIDLGEGKEHLTKVEEEVENWSIEQGPGKTNRK